MCNFKKSNRVVFAILLAAGVGVCVGGAVFGLGGFLIQCTGIDLGLDRADVGIWGHLLGSLS
ncbi:MAG: hypothetical protein AMJ75_02760 [Phycisphaerae bacterium SM1_79]|nr:MAG: hypothetical protein AMJ75_02760 [Phycisphaerae bacterium SM1_79]